MRRLPGISGPVLTVRDGSRGLTNALARSALNASSRSLPSAMDQNATALERAFHLAKSGHFATIDAIKRQLRAGGYLVATVTGTTLSKQLRALIQASQAASSATKQGAPYGGRAQEQWTTTFFIEPAQYGWSVRAGTEQLGLFVTQRQALIDVKRRQEKCRRTASTA